MKRQWENIAKQQGNCPPTSRDTCIQAKVQKQRALLRGGVCTHMPVEVYELCSRAQSCACGKKATSITSAVYTKADGPHVLDDSLLVRFGE